MKKLFATLALCFAFTACSGAAADPGDPSAEEYAVWSAAVDAALEGTEYRRVALHPRTQAPSADSLPVFYLSRGRGPHELVREYLQQNANPVRVPASRFKTARVKVSAPMPGWAREMIGTLGAMDGELSVSRVAFDARRTVAVVTVVAECGPLCGYGTTLMMERATEGTWRPVGFLEHWRS